MLPRNVGNHSDKGLHRIGGIEPPSKTDLNYGDIRFGLSYEIERDRGGKLKKRGSFGIINATDLFSSFDYRFFRYQRTVHPDPLTEIVQMGRCIKSGLIPSLS